MEIPAVPVKVIFKAQMSVLFPFESRAVCVIFLYRIREEGASEIPILVLL
jgi:hypothetical protein